MNFPDERNFFDSTDLIRIDGVKIKPLIEPFF